MCRRAFIGPGLGARDLLPARDEPQHAEEREATRDENILDRHDRLLQCVYSKRRVGHEGVGEGAADHPAKGALHDAQILRAKRVHVNNHALSTRGALLLIMMALLEPLAPSAQRDRRGGEDGGKAHRPQHERTLVQHRILLLLAHTPREERLEGVRPNDLDHDGKGVDRKQHERTRVVARRELAHIRATAEAARRDRLCDEHRDGGRERRERCDTDVAHVARGCIARCNVPRAAAPPLRVLVLREEGFLARVAQRPSEAHADHLGHQAERVRAPRLPLVRHWTNLHVRLQRRTHNEQHGNVSKLCIRRRVRGAFELDRARAIWHREHFEHVDTEQLVPLLRQRINNRAFQKGGDRGRRFRKTQAKELGKRNRVKRQ